MVQPDEIQKQLGGSQQWGGAMYKVGQAANRDLQSTGVQIWQPGKQEESWRKAGGPDKPLQRNCAATLRLVVPPLLQPECSRTLQAWSWLRPLRLQQARARLHRAPQLRPLSLRPAAGAAPTLRARCLAALGCRCRPSAGA